MGRKPSRWAHLPPRMRARERGAKIWYYYDHGGRPRRETPLGSDYIQACARWAELERGTAKATPAVPTFADACAAYQREDLPRLAAKSQTDYQYAIRRLLTWFNDPPAPLDAIQPRHWEQYAKTRPAVAATREKAVFAAVWRRAVLAGYTTAPCPAAAWRGTTSRRRYAMAQDVYRVDPGLYPALVTTALDADMPADVLYRLPEWCIYVETPDLALDGAPVPGAYVHLEHDVHTGRAELRMLLDGDGPLVPVAIHIGPWTLAEAISRSLHVSAARASAVGARTIGGLAELLLPVVEPVVNVVLYIATQAGEITGPGTPGNPTPVRTRRHGLRLFPANGVRAWDVGVRIGAALRAAYHAAETSSDPAARHRPRPHVRRAHWHTFLSGPRAEARRRDVRWMPPIPVNVQSADDMPATVRRVR